MITILCIPYNLVLGKNIQQFKSSLALLKVLEKNQMMSVAAFPLASKKHLMLLNMIFFCQSLNIMVCIVLLVNGLHVISWIESNMFQSMIMILILLLRNLVILKGQFLIYCCLWYIVVILNKAIKILWISSLCQCHYFTCLW